MEDRLDEMTAEGLLKKRKKTTKMIPVEFRHLGEKGHEKKELLLV